MRVRGFLVIQTSDKGYYSSEYHVSNINKEISVHLEVSDKWRVVKLFKKMKRVIRGIRVIRVIRVTKASFRLWEVALLATTE